MNTTGGNLKIKLVFKSPPFLFIKIMLRKKDKYITPVRNTIEPDFYLGLRQFAGNKHNSIKDAYFYSFVYSCLTTRAEILSKGDICVYVKQGRQQKPLNNDNDFTRLLSNPNSLTARQTFPKFLNYISLNLDIYGNCLFYIQKLGNKITQLIPLITSRVIPKYSLDLTRIDYFQYSNGSNLIQYKPSEILHFKIDNPNNLLWGKPTIDSIKTQINIDYLQHKYLENYFEYDGVPNAIIETESAMDEEKITALRKRWWERFRDWTMRNVPMVLSNNNKYIQTQKDPKQNNVVAIAQQSKSDIMSGLKIPPIVMGMVTMNYANASAGLKTMIENTIRPFCSLHIESELQRFCNDNFNTNLIIKIDYDTLYDIDTLMKLHEFYMKNGVTTRNEIRVMDNLDEVPNEIDPRMNEYMIPNNITGFNKNQNNNSNAKNNLEVIRTA